MCSSLPRSVTVRLISYNSSGEKPMRVRTGGGTRSPRADRRRRWCLTLVIDRQPVLLEERREGVPAVRMGLVQAFQSLSA